MIFSRLLRKTLIRFASAPTRDPPLISFANNCLENTPEQTLISSRQVERNATPTYWAVNLKREFSHSQNTFPFEIPTIRPLQTNILAIGNFGDKRHPTIPEVATSTEQNLKTRAENAYYILGPQRHRPTTIADILARTFQDTLQSPEVNQELKKLSIDPTFRSGEDLRKHLAVRVEAFQRLSVDAKN